MPSKDYAARYSFNDRPLASREKLLKGGIIVNRTANGETKQVQIEESDRSYVTFNIFPAKGGLVDGKAEPIGALLRIELLHLLEHGVLGIGATQYTVNRSRELKRKLWNHEQYSWSRGV